MPAPTRRDMLKLTAATAAALTIDKSSLTALADNPRLSEAKLAAPAFTPLPVGEVKPAGWLRRQLRVQADGLGGHLDEFWPDVGPNSGWLGGTGESWERGPYFLDGLIPLAYQLNDATLKSKAQKFVEWTLTNQSADGMIGPARNQDWWPRMIMVKALAQYFEATGDPRVLPALTKYFVYQLSEMPHRPLQEWGKYRWQDEVLVIEWLYDRAPDPGLLKLAELLRQQGYDWEAGFADFKFTAATKKSEMKMETHGVNNGQALKVAAIQYRLNSDAAERDRYYHQMSMLDKYHGMPNGMFSCDEHLAGLDPSHGTELCTVVETMFSMEVALATFGDAQIADRLERIAFNALPGTFTDDMWAHQYDQQPNQVQVGLNSKPWTTNGPESNLYGLEPNFGCCTANFHQGWPKFTTYLWMKTHDEGLVAAIYSPCEVRTIIRGTRLQIAVDTDYPFRDSIRSAITTEKPVHLPISFRIPKWSSNSTITLNGKPLSVPVVAGTFVRIEREWRTGDVIELKLPMQPQVSRWYAQSIAIDRGPLVYSLDLHGSWLKLRERGLTADWQVFPTREWNYALLVNEATAANLQVTEHAVGARPFASSSAPVQIHVRAKRLNQWLSEDGVAQPIPLSPVSSAEAEEELTFIPYGAAKLRITAFPELNNTKS
jgi:hypothetical protein